jgi:excisionase family DNA binding protein
MSDKAALFVRLPHSMLATLDVMVRTTGRTKQSLVTELVGVGLDSPGPGLAGAVGQSQPEVVCDLDEIAALLRVSPDQVMARIGTDGLPGRRFGDEWRFSKTAVLRWLDGADRVDDRKPGFRK